MLASMFASSADVKYNADLFTFGSRMNPGSVPVPRHKQESLPELSAAMELQV